MTELFLKIINMSISASWLVLAVLLLRLILRKAPKWVNVLLWGIVAVRLAFPFSIESALSLIPSAETISPGIMMDTMPSVQTGVPAINSVINPVIGSSLAPAPGASANPLQIWIPILSIVWVIGVAALLLYTAASYWRLRCKVSEAVILRDNIFQSENVASPFVLGIIRPKIYLPYNMDGQDLSHVVAHEQAHIRRRDHWWKPLGFLLLTIHWFNPLMWLAYVLLCRDIELACDEKVIKELGNEQRADYTQALVACSVNRRMIAACPLAFGEVGVKERVKSVMNYKKPAFWVIVLAVIACAVVAVCFLTNPIENDNAGKNLEYYITSYLSNSQQTEIQRAYNRENRSLSVTVHFETTEGPTEINLVYGYKKNGVGNDWTYSDPVALLLGESTTFTVSADHHFSFSATSLDGANGNVKLVFTESKSTGNQLNNPDEETPENITFEAEVLEIHDGYYLVAPEASWALNSADRIEVPMMNMDPAMEPQVGDTIEIVCSGEILETYPARLNEVYSIKVALEAPTVTKWFDYLNSPSEMEGGLTTEFSEYPGVTFQYTVNQIIASKPFNGSDLNGHTILVSGMPIWNAYFTDLTGDALPEICATYTYGSGIIDSRIVICDYASGASYELSDRGYHDFTLRLNENDGQLYVDKRVYPNGKLISSGRLVYEDDCIQIIGQEMTNASITDIEDPTKAEGFSYDTAMEKFFEDEANEYYFSGIYSQYVIVHYADGTQEDIVSALNAGRATIADLDRFGIRYTVDSKELETVFEANFGGNTSFGQKMELTENYPYWCIEIENTGDGTIQMELEGEVYRVEAGTTKAFYSDEKWEAGTYAVSFSTTGYQPMQGSAVCTRSKAPMIDSQTTSEEITKHDLTTGDLEVPVEDLGDYVFYTNSEQISVTVKGNDFDGQVNLLDASQNNDHIRQFKINTRDDNCLFTGLTSARLYRVDCEGLDGCTVVISGDN